MFHDSWVESLHREEVEEALNGHKEQEINKVF